MNNIKKPRKYENEHEWQRVWEYHKEADNLFHQRFAFFLVAESMLIISFATLFNQQEKHVKTAICILGLIYTYGWYFVNIRLDKKMEFLKKHFLEENDSIYEAYMKCVRDIKRWDIFNDEIFPIATFLFWLFLLLQLFIPIEPICILLIMIGLLATGFLINGCTHWILQEKYEKILKDLQLK